MGTKLKIATQNTFLNSLSLVTLYAYRDLTKMAKYIYKTLIDWKKNKILTKTRFLELLIKLNNG